MGWDPEPLFSEEERLLAIFRPYARRLAFYRGVIKPNFWCDWI